MKGIFLEMDDIFLLYDMIYFFVTGYFGSRCIYVEGFAIIVFT